MKKILLIITGSIAAYKSIELIRILQKKSYEVEVILTKSAQKFVTELLVASIAKNKIHTELFDDGENGMSHINLSRRNDLIIVAPASADFIAKMTHGFGDDLASTTILAANKPIFIAPAMNEKMWNYQSNIENIEKLKNRDINFIEPEKDELACGEVGVGKMADPSIISNEIDSFFAYQNKLSGKNIIITGGSTREKIDPVRFIGNNSSGKQAIYLANILKKMGGDVKLIAGNIEAKIPLEENKITKVVSADEMFLATKNLLSNSKPENTIFIACAAVCDYKIADYSQHKIKKEKGQNLTLNLTENVDILQNVGNSDQRPNLVIGFAAEGENIIEYARKKLKQKKCDLIVANNIAGGKIFNNEDSDAILVEENQENILGKISKKLLSQKIADWIIKNS